MGEKRVDVEQQIFIKDDEEAWIEAIIVRKSKTEVICKIKNGDERTVKMKDFRRAELPYVNSIMVADLVDMKYLHEPGVLANLISRHEDGKPYTRSRDVVISINPCRWLHHLYCETNQQIYADKLIWQIVERDPRQDLEPHIYEVSALAYSEMAFQGKNQSIIITGESGSGKTEAVKLMMHHLARIQLGPYHKMSVYQSSSTAATVTSRKSFSDVVDRILYTNPILEAFGNASTAQNENSSRFGKHVQLQFDNYELLRQQSSIPGKSVAGLVGSVCDVYLLETSRVCSHATNERTYHIFYQLLAASDAQKSLVWNGIVGKIADDFKYVGTPTTNAIDGTSDKIKFSETWLALSRIGIADGDTVMLMQAICIVLQLGNIEFAAYDDKADVSTKLEFSNLSDLLGISTDQLLPAFTQRTMTTRNETFNVPLSLSSAIEARDAMAKNIYLNAFTWLVETLNSKTTSTLNSMENHDQHENGIIGLLDIFGFESFTTNRFEQLCINYANEKLQNKALRDIFSAVREEYEYEGLSLDVVEVASNEQLLQLLDGRCGLIALLNEESYLPKGNSKSFTAKVIEKFKSSSLITSPNSGIYNQFGIVHYAGTVTYTTDNFLISNQDTLPIDLKSCISKCHNPIAAGSQKSISFEQNELGLPTSVDSTRDIASPSILSPSSTPPLRSISEHVKRPNMSIGRKWELEQDKFKGRQRSIAEIATNFDSLNSNSWKDLRMKPTENPSNAMSTLNERQTIGTGSSNRIAGTVWTKYRAQLNALMKKLGETHSRYVRCIKPNNTMIPRVCDRIMISKQLRYTGLVPTIALSRAIFTKSISNKLLLSKFKLLWDVQKFPSKAKRFDTIGARRKLDCEALLLCLSMSHGSDLTPSGVKELPYVVGKTRSYFRQGVLEWLESTRMRELERFVTIIQKNFRGGLVRKRITRMILAASTIQFWFRSIKKTLASLEIQRLYRGYTKKKIFLALKKSTLITQRYVRGFQCRAKNRRYCHQQDPISKINAAHREIEAQLHHIYHLAAAHLTQHDRHELINESLEDRLLMPESTNRAWAAQLIPLIHSRAKAHLTHSHLQDIRRFSLLHITTL